MKIDIVDASVWVNRMFEACTTFQWAREFLKNSQEAGATRVEFGIEWQGVEKCGVYRRTIADDGSGMNREDLRDFFSTLGAGNKKIGWLHDNFGVGAKIASLPWNPEGVVVISYKDGQAAMIWIALDPESSEYELVEFEDAKGKSCVIDPREIEWDDGDIDWSAIGPEWAREHGTVIVLLGSKEYPDTVLGNPDAGETDIKGLSVFLNTRFWDLSNMDVKVVELRSDKKSHWPQGSDERDDTRRPNNRRIMGAKHYVTEVKSSTSQLVATDTAYLDDGRVLLEWYLWEGERPNIHMYAKKSGYIAVLYNDELFHLTSGKVQFRHFGIVESKVQQKLTIILEPEHYAQEEGRRWGVHPDQSRARLNFTGGGIKGGDIPFGEWGAEFADDLPRPILDAILKARGENSGSLDDDEYRQRLQDKFGDRWTIKALVEAKRLQEQSEPASVISKEIETLSDPKPHRPRSQTKRRKTLKVIRKKACIDGTDDGIMVEVPVDVPQYRTVGAEEFDVPWHLALWAPHDPAGPTVLINTESPILEEVVRYHQDQYPPVYAEEIAQTIYKVFGEVAVAKIAHSQKLTKDVAEEELDLEYRTEKALTIALMGLLAEESLIHQRLGKFGRKRSAA